MTERYELGATREAKMATGTVKVWSKANGYGWIQPDGPSDRVYVHKTGVVRRDENRAAWLEPGERVEYQMGTRPKGPAAVNVRVIDAAPATEGDDATS
jgi:cold shock CspA family protein